MKTVLVTGAAGFIGAKTAEMLLDRGSRVIGVDNLNDYYDVRLKEHRLAELKKRSDFSFVKLDIENFPDVRSLFRTNSIDVVINLAARAGVRSSMENPHIYMATNAIGALNILEAMHEYAVGKLVLASTSSLYAGQQMPFSESLPVNTPISPYAASKKAAEVTAYTYHYLYGLDISVVRYFTVYGPAGRPDMCVFRFIRRIDEGAPIELNGTGDQSRDFTFVDDIARGTIEAMADVGYEIVNLGGGNEPKSINYVIAKIEQCLDKKAVINAKPFHKADMMATRADIAKAKQLFDWSPRIDLDSGIEKTVHWYLENKEWVRDIRL